MRHELLFPEQCRDLDTGKLSIDKMMTLNSNTCMSELVKSGTSTTYEYLLACSIAHERAEEREREHQDWLANIRRIKERELREHREQEDNLIKEQLQKEKDEKAQAQKKLEELEQKIKDQELSRLEDERIRNRIKAQQDRAALEYKKRYATNIRPNKWFNKTNIG